MQHKVLNRMKRPAPRRLRPAAANRRQYSLFGAAPLVPQADARHFRRQAQLCQRLIATLHQPDLVEMLGRLHEEFEQTALRIEAAGAASGERL